MCTSFSLYQFDDDCCCLLANCCFYCRKVVVADVAHARHEGGKRFTVMRFPCRCKCTHRATVKAAQRRNYTCTSCGQTSKLECSFNRFCATVTEKDVRQSFRREACQPFEEACPHIVVHDFWTGNQSLRLVCQRCSNLRSPMTYISNSMTGSAVNIFAP